jgi:hypothetical protein
MAIGVKNISSPQRDIAMLAVRKTGAGTPVLSGLCANFCTVVDNGVGDFTIIINKQRPFAQAMIATATPHSSGIIRLDVATSDKLQISVKCFAVNGTTPAELDFDLIALGSYASDLNS